jgi:6,7-dimethyl-8-ribityllumazine synthase
VRSDGSGALAAPAGARVVAGGEPDPASRFAIVASRYHADIVQPLVDGAFAELAEAGIGPERVTLCPVPGAFELALAARSFAMSGRYAAVVCLGCVIQGETPHFTFVCAEAARGCTLVALETGVPVAFGVITANTRAQAEARAGGAVGNKGHEAAAAAIDLAGVLRAIPPA